jgi:hypothetical protein
MTAVRSLVLFLVVALSLAACSAPRETTTEPAPPPTEPRFPAYETFDPADYGVEPPPAQTEIRHDVPAALMEGTIEEVGPEGPRTVQGYRLQVYSSADKASAEGVRDEAAAWWRTVQDDPDALELLPHGLPMEVDFNQPYYRVRLGAFEYRREAEQAIRVIQRRFPDAFIVPDLVTIGGAGGR